LYGFVKRFLGVLALWDVGGAVGAAKRRTGEAVSGERRAASGERGKGVFDVLHFS